MADVHSSADPMAARPSEAPAAPGSDSAGRRDRAREYAVDQLVRRLQNARYTAAGRDGWWWPRWRDARAVSLLQRAVVRACRFDGAPEEAFLRYAKVDLLVHVVTDLKAGPDAMKERMEGICSAGTLDELRNFVRASTGRPNWDFTS
ncbi:hypothetical protein [Kitasatospora sp. NPDC059827]|uniref:hypothetical protein n=1 Tax=Kitasatospora sp. NPDC059827 TaxID=3346964 RepID=UPI0036526EE1